MTNKAGNRPVNSMHFDREPVHSPPEAGPYVWQVGALCHAIADALEARFNPVAVAGEISGFSRAASGHCYFSLKDANGQLRCAMFRRAASLLDFSPRDGDRVEVRGRLGVYEPRGELQLVVESLRRAGQGSLFEQFLQLKTKLEAQGLFDPQRKRKAPSMPRAIGVVTSLGAAALHDVTTALQRRVPHIPVLVAPTRVQGGEAPRELTAALRSLYALAAEVASEGTRAAVGVPVVDVILLVRGGGSIEDLWAFNDEQLAYTIASSPVPIVSGVGHETDFTIADFVADLRAPTPTAAAELVSAPREVLARALDDLETQLRLNLTRHLERQAQGLDHLAARMGRPSAAVAQQRGHLTFVAQSLQHAQDRLLVRQRNGHEVLEQALQRATRQALLHQRQVMERAVLRVQALDPRTVLQRGYAWLADPDGRAVSRVAQAHLGQRLQATLSDGTVDVQVQGSQAF